MLKQLLYIAFVLSSIISFSQAGSWENFIITDTSRISTKNSFVVIKLDREEVLKIKRIGISPIRKLGDDYFVFKNDNVLLKKYELLSISNEWKFNVNHKSKMAKQFIVKSLSPLDLMGHSDITIIEKYASTGIYIIECSYEAVQLLSQDDEVIYISDEIIKPNVESRVIDMNINPNRVNKVHHFFPLINGSSETISIQENNFNELDIDLIGRYTESGLESTVIDNHANEMATIIAGAGNSFVTGEGVAKNVGITSSNFFPVLPDDDDDYTRLGIHTQNHSYGTLIEPFYGAQAEAFDQSAVNNRNLLHVFSIGNQGLVIPSEGAYAQLEGYANITGNYKMSKNTLSVGSIDTVGRELAFVSRGPAYDGRVKPEVVAYSSVGSSNSAALVSGVSILLQQQYREMYGGDMPSALIKALLINSAEDVGLEGLDFVTGYGSVNAFRSLQSLQNNQFVTGSISQEEVDQIVLNIPTDARNLKLTLVWTDIPANPLDASALINDLDLKLLDGDLNTTLPWVLNHSPNVSSLSLPATRKIDRLNNVEQITIDSPADLYTIEVDGFLVVDEQDYYIAYQYDQINSFEWDYPTGSDNMPFNGESGSYFRWNTTMSGSGQLAYSIDQGNNWIELGNNIEISKGFWRWNSIPDISTEAMVRMKIGANEFESESFTISKPFKTKVGFNCADSLMLRWAKIPNAESYTVYNLGLKILEEVSTVTDTFLIIPQKAIFTDKRFSIQPNLVNGKSFIRSPTFDSSLQGVDCYVISFFQQVALDTGIYLRLNLGTTLGIDELEFYRRDGLKKVKVGNYLVPDKDLITILDPNPNQGYNEHFVIVKFSNGEQLELSSGTTNYLTETPIIISPNPVFRTEELNLLFRDFESQSPIFRIYNVRGSEILVEVDISTQESISITNLVPGMYIYRLEDGSNSYSGRLLVK